MIRTNIKTSVGALQATFSDPGVARLEFPGRSDASQTNGVSQSNSSRETQRWERLTRAAVKSLLDGHAPDNLPPLDLSEGTEFQRRVWSALKAIPFGKTRSY